VVSAAPTALVHVAVDAVRAVVATVVTTTTELCPDRSSRAVFA
jgi:hypothetical protein